MEAIRIACYCLPLRNCFEMAVHASEDVATFGGLAVFIGVPILVCVPVLYFTYRDKGAQDERSTVD
jgi:hypothetical protein